MRKNWETREGEKIPYTELKDSHLLNIFKWIERKAKNGMEMITGGGGFDAEDIWYETEYLEGKEVLELYDYKGLIKEAKRRKLKYESPYTQRKTQRKNRRG